MSAIQSPPIPPAPPSARPKRRAGAEPRRKRAPKTAKIVKPSPKSLSDLPRELFELVVKYIVPDSLLEGSGLISPLSRPYAPHHKAITANHAFRNERFGAVPTGLLDLYHFGRTCHTAWATTEHLVRAAGASKKPTGEKPSEVDKSVKSTKKHLYIKLEHMGENADNLFKLMLENRDTLEEVVLYSCGSHDNNKLRTCQHEISDPISAFNTSTPLQALYKDGHPLPKLQRLQLGPDLCIACVRVALRLFTGKVFDKRHRPPPASTNTLVWDIAQPYTNTWTARHVTYEHEPAPLLRSIQILIPPMLSNAHRMAESDRVRKMLECIPLEASSKIEVFSMVLRGQMDRRWGGFGVSGGTTRVTAKTKEQAEESLAERAQQIVFPLKSGAAKKEREEKAQDKVARYNTQLKATKIKPEAGKKDDDPMAAALLAAISTIQPVKEKEPNGKSEKHDRIVAEALDALGEASDLRQKEADAAIAQQDKKAAEPKEVPDKGRLDKGKGKAVEMPATLNIAALQDGVDPALVSDEEDDGDVDEVARDSPDVNGASGSGTANGVGVKEEKVVKDKKGAQSRNHIANHGRMESQISTILGLIAERFPNLVSLQLCRGGSVRTDILEGPGTLDTMITTLVRPIHELEKLRHLDLGLAVIGRREVEDFPIGLPSPDFNYNLAKSAKKLGLNNALLEQERNRLHTKDVQVAVGAGDDWRKMVIARCALGQGAVTVEDDRETSPPKPITWPKSVRSGFVYSPDLLERIKYRGFLSMWEKDVVNGQEILVWDRRNVIL